VFGFIQGCGEDGMGFTPFTSRVRIEFFLPRTYFFRHQSKEAKDLCSRRRAGKKERGGPAAKAKIKPNYGNARLIFATKRTCRRLQQVSAKLYKLAECLYKNYKKMPNAKRSGHSGRQRIHAGDRCRHAWAMTLATLLHDKDFVESHGGDKFAIAKNRPREFLRNDK